ncbi:MAG: 2-C-methyl-D-erythritol 4-phosphate cytidylyltransferase [Clostridiales bacterium]|nr:2-C-methyl-D-erythritol 4-phosphate cytidylyltransferase [Clostridiales bacterium]MBS5877961.1 2-C-methyl-D-erythritol 4-phosphate cytidylyltransferase [Clostridiales bacterium]MDU0939920.1 2-C-methyl-D-erythritol 4-phosphate cytidylyltransferase [Clostridiales bacterium]MDU1042464.1 2-C-methyl-D-erythritol 4-phosphate cytidylyltransferase [Clostridiales bacterium]
MSYKKIAIILAGGTGKRMGGDIPKQFLKLEGKTVLSYSVEAFEKSDVDGIMIVVSPYYREQCKEEIIDRMGISKFIGFADPGSERVYSVKNALKRVEEYLELTYKPGCGCRCGRCDDPAVDPDAYVFIHDGARPLISEALIKRSIEAVGNTGACIPAIQLNDTVKLVDEGVVTATPDRSRLRSVQTPQCFDVKLLKEAYEKWENNGKTGFIPTDDASLIENFTEAKVIVLDGEEKNLKITRPADMELAKNYLKI